MEKGEPWREVVGPDHLYLDHVRLTSPGLGKPYKSKPGFTDDGWTVVAQGVRDTCNEGS